MSITHHSNGRFPTELLLSIFIHLDGPTLASCSRVCRQWHNAITHFDELIWSRACRRDFLKTRRFWSLQFPELTQTNSLLGKQKRTWQDMYRITKNWYTGHCTGYYPEVDQDRSTDTLIPCAVIGDPQEHGMFTTLTLAYNGSIIRSNPNYQTASEQSLMIQSPQTHEKQYIQWSNLELPGWPEAAASHTIVCHHTLPSTPWLVTGGLNGTVAIWDLEKRSLVRMWHGHRGRVLCISMNDEAVLSGGADSMIQVWDLNMTDKTKNLQRPTQRGMIDISRYLSERNDWYQGVGEIAANHNLVACAPDASGPILIFSLLTGSLVYELKIPQASPRMEWATEDITAFTRLRLTPYFLLTKGKISNKSQHLKIVPSTQNVILQRNKLSQSKQVGYMSPLKDHNPSPHVAQMTPYQLYLYYQSMNSGNERSDSEEEQLPTPDTNDCIHVWDLQTAKIVYRLLPVLPKPNQYYTITDIQLSPDYSKVFAIIQIRGKKQYEEHLFCWDFSIKNIDDPIDQCFKVLELDTKDSSQQKIGTSWVCFM
ncbi:WD40 repeat-like protein [Rhizopus microsporus var. microsporus]|uniref:WD40 repeat-like protein n=2 Tax=Rhizopus microsporus TaxID=58291 RepID=A0A2G4T4Z3_RHIZD|nr:WD40 repeat-like protein [Rhizopus microsporus ATCC 52813]ORE04255.1 WD40 repeat-like protein [Rhizopus microsporus var. microsporus]PHZ16068.1 WD40 repeat-like protein [Rhizopus microsporus ATCC 52813]